MEASAQWIFWVQEREKVYSSQYNNAAVETVSNNTKQRAVRKAQGPS